MLGRAAPARLTLASSPPRFPLSKARQPCAHAACPCLFHAGPPPPSSSARCSAPPPAAPPWPLPRPRPGRTGWPTPGRSATAARSPSRSGGMRQRVMIAIAIACDPAVLIADEPTTALDVTVQAGILEVLRSLRERLGTAIVLITHDLGVVADIADRVLVMYAGRAVEQAPVDDLFADPRHPCTRGLLGAVPVRDRPAAGEGRPRLQEIPGLVPSLAEQPDRCTFQPRCAAADQQCATARPALRRLRDGHDAACWHPVQTPTPHRPKEAAQ